MPWHGKLFVFPHLFRLDEHGMDIKHWLVSMRCWVELRAVLWLAQCMTAETKLKLLRARMSGAREGAAELRRRELEYLSLVRIQVSPLPPEPPAVLLAAAQVYVPLQASSAQHQWRLDTQCSAQAESIWILTSLYTCIHVATWRTCVCADEMWCRVGPGLRESAVPGWQRAGALWLWCAGDEQALPCVRHGHPEVGGLQQDDLLLRRVLLLALPAAGARPSSNPFTRLDSTNRALELQAE